MRRATELQQGVVRAQERLRFAERQLGQFDATSDNSEAAQRTRSKLSDDIQRAKHDAEILSRMLRELVPL